MKKYLILFLLLGAGVETAKADKILLENGDLIKGKVESVTSGVLTMTTDYSDPLKVKTDKIVNIATENPITIHLNTGEILKGKIVSGKDGELKVEDSKGRGRATLNWARVESINPPPNAWHGNFLAGGSLQTGNTERLAYSIGFNANRRFKDDRFEFKFLHNYAEEDDTISARNTYGSMKFDHFYSAKWYGYVVVEMLNDRFKDLNLRTIVGPGVGYQVWDDAVKALRFEGGISYFSEDLREQSDVQYFTARLASSLVYHFTDKLVFTDDLTVFPSLEETGDYTLRNEMAISTSLGGSWKLKLSNIFEQNNNPPPGIEETDLTWLLALGYGF
jgi:putative salt-induced outer membrane protein YdiY